MRKKIVIKALVPVFLSILMLPTWIVEVYWVTGLLHVVICAVVGPVYLILWNDKYGSKNFFVRAFISILIIFASHFFLYLGLIMWTGSFLSDSNAALALALMAFVGVSITVGWDLLERISKALARKSGD